MASSGSEFVDKSPNRSHLIGPLFEELPAPVCPGAKALYAHWRSVKPHNDLPTRADFGIDSVGRLGLVGNFFVIEPLDGGADWRYRLMGSKICWLFGRDVSNIPFSEHFYPDEAQRCIALSNEVARSHQPIFLHARFISGRHFGELETMSLPVWNKDRSAVWLVGASFPTGDAARWESDGH